MVLFCSEVFWGVIDQMYSVCNMFLKWPRHVCQGATGKMPCATLAARRHSHQRVLGKHLLKCITDTKVQCLQ